MSETLEQRLISSLRTATQAFAPGDQVAPCAVLWTDPDRLWANVMKQMQALMPELYILGPYNPEYRSGPALWLRCIEARVVAGAPSPETTPVFYLPGISREELRGVEDCSMEVAALVELQFRGVLWIHPNGKEWTPNGFLVSKHGGLGLEVAKDQATLDAMAGALPILLQEPISTYRVRRLDAEFFNGMLAPDATGLFLRWLSAPDPFKKARPAPEWLAFCQQCKTEFGLDPVKDGPLKAARSLATKANAWAKVWQRYAEAPATYPGLVDWLRRAAPREQSMFDTADVWPDKNEMEERKLSQSLEVLVERPQAEVIKRIAELETSHSQRRNYPWQKLGLSPLATALEPLARLAVGCATSPGAPTLEAYADYYASDGWRVDAAAIMTMGACGTPEQHGPVLGVVRAIYLPWLENTARHLQSLLVERGHTLSKRGKAPQPTPGSLILFADGLRMDAGHALKESLAANNLTATLEWEWSTIPSVTATAKPASSPVAAQFEGAESGIGFATRMISGGQSTSQDRFIATLNRCGWQYLRAEETGDPTGAAWTEAGALDKRGHNEGWKLARSVETEIRDIASRIGALFAAGWKEVTVVTDHGWLLVPGGLPKVELKSFLAEDRWGRCAALKAEAQPGIPVFKWHWNPSVAIACPPGVGCYRAGMEYSHGGVSLQELVTPKLRVTLGQASSATARITEAKWTGAKCRVSISGECQGLRLDLRTSLSDPTSSLLVDKQVREATSDGKVTLFLENDADVGRLAELVLLSSSGSVLHSLNTVLGK